MLLNPRRSHVSLYIVLKEFETCLMFAMLRCDSMLSCQEPLVLFRSDQKRHCVLSKIQLVLKSSRTDVSLRQNRGPGKEPKVEPRGRRSRQLRPLRMTRANRAAGCGRQIVDAIWLHMSCMTSRAKSKHKPWANRQPTNHARGHVPCKVYRGSKSVSDVCGTLPTRQGAATPLRFAPPTDW